MEPVEKQKYKHSGNLMCFNFFLDSNFIHFHVFHLHIQCQSEGCCGEHACFTSANQ